MNSETRLKNVIGQYAKSINSDTSNCDKYSIKNRINKKRVALKRYYNNLASRKLIESF